MKIKTRTLLAVLAAYSTLFIGVGLAYSLYKLIMLS